MAKKVFEVEVTRVDKYKIELDDAVMNEAWMEEFRAHMYEFYTLAEHAEHIGQFRARFDNGSFFARPMDGYGAIAIEGRMRKDAAFPFPAVNIIKLDEDNDIEVDVTEIEG